MILSEGLKNGIKILEHWQACSWVIDQKAILQCCDPGVGIHTCAWICWSIFTSLVHTGPLNLMLAKSDHKNVIR